VPAFTPPPPRGETRWKIAHSAMRMSGFADFALKSARKHRMILCAGTACIIKRSDKLLAKAEKRLGLSFDSKHPKSPDFLPYPSLMREAQ
jgi:hypothetical protein